MPRKPMPLPTTLLMSADAQRWYGLTITHRGDWASARAASGAFGPVGRRVRGRRRVWARNVSAANENGRSRGSACDVRAAREQRTPRHLNSLRAGGHMQASPHAKRAAPPQRDRPHEPVCTCPQLGQGVGTPLSRPVPRGII